MNHYIMQYYLVFIFTAYWKVSSGLLYLKLCLWHLFICFTLMNKIKGPIGFKYVNNRLVDKAREGECGRNWESSIDTYAPLCLKQIASRSYSITQGTQLGALWWPRGVCVWGYWEGGSGGREYVYIYSWFLFLYSRN